MSLLIFSQLDACFSGPVCSDLTSETGGPFASLQTVKVPQESNAAACCHDQRPTGKPDEDTDTYNCHLKEGESFHFRGSYLASAGRYLFTVPTASIRIKEKRNDEAFEDRQQNQVPLKETFRQRV